MLVEWQEYYDHILINVIALCFHVDITYVLKYKRQILFLRSNLNLTTFYQGKCDGCGDFMVVLPVVKTPEGRFVHSVLLVFSPAGEAKAPAVVPSLKGAAHRQEKSPIF